MTYYGDAAEAASAIFTALDIENPTLTQVSAVEEIVTDYSDEVGREEYESGYSSGLYDGETFSSDE